MTRPVPAISKKVLPPHWVLTCALLEVGLHVLFPVSHWVAPGWRGLGAVVAAPGLFLAGWAFALFRRAKTGLVPFSEASTLVAKGPYRFTRNPMYVGMASLVLGLAVALGSLSALVGPVLFVVLIDRLFVQHEERQLEAAFGPAYLAYRSKVRRWL